MTTGEQKAIQEQPLPGLPPRHVSLVSRGVRCSERGGTGELNGKAAEVRDVDPTKPQEPPGKTGLSKAMGAYSLFVVSSSQAVRGESLLLGNGLSCALMSLPRSLGSGCGVCLRVVKEDRSRTEEVLALAGIEVLSVHDFSFGSRG